MGEKFYDALMKSVLIQGTLTVGVTSVACYLWIVRGECPETLVALLGMAWGFYFRSKAGAEVRAQIAKDGSGQG